MLFIVRAGNAIGTHQRFAFNLETNHQEVAASKAQAFIAGGSKTKEGVVPMVNGENGFGVVCGHKCV